MNLIYRKRSYTLLSLQSAHLPHRTHNRLSHQHLNWIFLSVSKVHTFPKEINTKPIEWQLPVITASRAQTIDI